MKPIIFLFSTLVSFNAFSAPGDISAEDISYPLHVTTSSPLAANFTANFILSRETLKPVVTEETVRTPICLNTPVDPNSGDWKNYWNETNDTNRAQELSVAIHGIDMQTAQLIVRHGLFMYRPRYWAEFDQQMQNAQSALSQMGYHNDFYYAVTSTYGAENAHILGFWSDANCRLDDVTRKVTKMVTGHEPAGVFSRNYTVQIVNPTLQSFEHDDFNLVVGYNINSVDLDRNPQFNRYNVSLGYSRDGSVLVTLRAERKKVEIPQEALSATIERSSTGFVGMIHVDQRYTPTDDQGSNLQLYYELCANWFLGCRTLDETKTTIKMQGADAQISIDGTFHQNQDYRIRYRVSRTNSRFYSSEPTEALTDKLAY